MRPLRVAIAGTGAISDFHVPALRAAGFDVVAASSRPGSDRLKSFGARHGIDHLFERFEDLELASVDGVPAFWIPVPHPVVIETERGTETFLARGNVLIWEVEGITYRLETTLGKAGADALAESFG